MQIPSFLLSVSVGGALWFSSLCFAGPPAVNWWQDRQVVQALDLTDEQQRKIEERVQQGLKRREELTRQLAPWQRTISDLLSQPDLDEQKVLSALATQLELRNARRRETVSMRLHVRQVLTHEQFKKLLALNPGIMRQRWVKPQPRVVGLEKSLQKGRGTPDRHEEEDGEENAAP